MAGWVLGCHRSGTSLLCSILRNLSSSHREQPLGPDLPANPENPAGFHESVSLVEVNERLLNWAGSAWDRPFVARPAWEAPGESQAGFAESIGKSLHSLRSRVSAPARRGLVGRLTELSRPLRNGSSAGDANSSPGMFR